MSPGHILLGPDQLLLHPGDGRLVVEDDVGGLVRALLQQVDLLLVARDVVLEDLVALRGEVQLGGQLGVGHSEVRGALPRLLQCLVLKSVRRDGRVNQSNRHRGQQNGECVGWQSTIKKKKIITVITLHTHLRRP